MKQSKAQKPTRFTSVYRHGLDLKRRVQVPAAWRPEPGVELTLVLWPGQEGGSCLRVLLPHQMDKLMENIEALPQGDPKKVILKRIVGSKSVQVSLDGAGRILLPEEMTRAAGITTEAVLWGLLDRYEIWGPERYEKEIAAAEKLAPEALKLMD